MPSPSRDGEFISDDFPEKISRKSNAMPIHEAISVLLRSLSLSALLFFAITYKSRCIRSKWSKSLWSSRLTSLACCVRFVKIGHNPFYLFKNCFFFFFVLVFPVRHVYKYIKCTNVCNHTNALVVLDVRLRIVKYFLNISFVN